MPVSNTYMGEWSFRQAPPTYLPTGTTENRERKTEAEVGSDGKDGALPLPRPEVGDTCLATSKTRLLSLSATKDPISSRPGTLTPGPTHGKLAFLQIRPPHLVHMIP